MRNRTIVGEYSRKGYILFHVEGIRELYTAGNHAQDSGLVVPLDSPECLPLRKIRSMCVKTGKEMANERGWKWGGASRIREDLYDESD